MDDSFFYSLFFLFLFSFLTFFVVFFFRSVGKVEKEIGGRFEYAVHGGFTVDFSHAADDIFDDRFGDKDVAGYDG